MACRLLCAVVLTIGEEASLVLPAEALDDFEFGELGDSVLRCKPGGRTLITVKQADLHGAQAGPEAEFSQIRQWRKCAWDRERRTTFECRRQFMSGIGQCKSISRYGGQ